VAVPGKEKSVKIHQLKREDSIPLKEETRRREVLQIGKDRGNS